MLRHSALLAILIYLCLLHKPQSISARIFGWEAISYGHGKPDATEWLLLLCSPSLEGQTGRGAGWTGVTKGYFVFPLSLQPGQALW